MCVNSNFSIFQRDNLYLFQSAHLLKKSAPEIVKTSAEGTVSKEVTTVNGHPDDSSSIQSREVEETVSTPKNDSGSQDQTSNDNDVRDATPASKKAGKLSIQQFSDRSLLNVKRKVYLAPRPTPND